MHPPLTVPKKKIFSSPYPISHGVRTTVRKVRT